MHNKQFIGVWGEQRAAHFLIRKDYIIVERNFWTKYGEIDIVATTNGLQDELVWCFVEVKTRSGADGYAEHALSHRKMLCIKKALLVYISRFGAAAGSLAIRIEHISVYVNKKNKTFRIYHYIIPSF